MDGSIPNEVVTSECHACGSQINPRAQLCLVCKSYRKPWKNWLTFYGSGAGLAAAIASAFIFVFGGVTNIYRSEFGTHRLETLYFEYPGDAGFVNAGEQDLIIQSIIIEWPSSNLRSPLLLPVNRAIKSGEIQFVSFESRYPEPPGIKTAAWKFGPPSSAQVADAFAIGKHNRCSVFHVYKAGHPGFQIIEEAHAGNDGQHLTTIPAIAKVNVFSLKTGLVKSETLHSLTAFLQIPNCGKLQLGDNTSPRG